MASKCQFLTAYILEIKNIFKNIIEQKLLQMIHVLLTICNFPFLVNRATQGVTGPAPKMYSTELFKNGKEFQKFLNACLKFYDLSFDIKQKWLAP